MFSFNRLMSSLSKDKTRRDISLAFIIMLLYPD